MSNGKEISLLKRTASGVFVREVAETLVKGKIIFSGGALIFVRLFVGPDFTISMVVGANSLLLVSVAECNSETKSLTVVPSPPLFFFVFEDMEKSSLQFVCKTKNQPLHPITLLSLYVRK